MTEKTVEGCILILIAITVAYIGTVFYILNDNESVCEQSISEGEAKSYLVALLTGHNLTPEVAQYVNVNLTGTTIDIDTNKLSVVMTGKK